LKAAQVALDRLLEGVLTHKNSDGSVKVDQGLIVSFRKDFEDAINDDLNIPRAMGVAWNIARYGTKSRELYDLLLKMDEVFGLDFTKAAEKQTPEEPALDPEIEALVNQRQQARKEKNWKLADEIRDKLGSMGYQLEDTPQGVKVVQKS
jgi:cysteinyl-tRNA synthetase